MQEVNGWSEMCMWYKVESIIHTLKNQINKWKNQMNLWTNAVETELNVIIQSTKTYTLGLIRMWAYKCKLHQLYVTKERKNLNILVSNRMTVWHVCENANYILGCVKQGILVQIGKHCSHFLTCWQDLSQNILCNILHLIMVKLTSIRCRKRL